MSTLTALPALAVNPPANPIDQYSKVLQVKSLLQEQQVRQQQLTDQQAMTQAMKTADPTSPTFYDDVAKGVLKNGGSANAALGVQQHALTIKKTVSDIAAQDAATGSKNLETYIGKHKAVGDALEGIENVPDDQLHQHALDTITDLTKNNILDQDHAQKLIQGVQSTPDPAALRAQIDVVAKSSMGAKAVAEQAHTAAQTGAETAKANLDKANTFLAQNKADVINQYKQHPEILTNGIDAIFPPQTPQNSRYRFLVGQALSTGDVDAAKETLKQAAGEKAGLEKESFTQNAENVRQSLNRQAMQSNELQRNGLSQLDKLFTDPQHGYSQFLAQANSTKGALEQAKDGNELASSLAPLMTVLGVNSFAGIHRVNPQEIAAAGPHVGSLYRQLNTTLDKAVSGTMNADTRKEMGSVIDSLIAAKHQSLVPAAKLVAQNAGLDPTKTSVLDKDGSVTTLDKLPVQQASRSGPAPSGKSVSLAAARQLPINKGKSDAQITADIKAHGHEVAP